jgi:hypothetical protein
VQTTISVPDSPFGVLVQRRACVPTPIWRLIPSVWLRRARLFEGSARLGFIRYLLWPCAWQDMGERSQSPVVLSGGDVAVVNFVTP